MGDWTVAIGLLLVAASQGHYLWPAIGMLTYSITFAAPFFLLALFPQYLARVPKSGGWLNSVKVVMGFLEFATPQPLLFVLLKLLAYFWKKDCEPYNLPVAGNKVRKDFKLAEGCKRRAGPFTQTYSKRFLREF